MEITTVDIQEKQFHIRFRGFDVREVDSFLEDLAEGFEELSRKNQLQQDEIRRAKGDIEQYKVREKTLKQAMMNAEKALDDMRASAEKEAELIIADAEVRAQKMLNAAHNRLAQIHEDISELKRQRVQFEVQFRSLIESYSKLLDVDKEEFENLEAAEDKLRFLRKG